MTAISVFISYRKRLDASHRDERADTLAHALRQDEAFTPWLDDQLSAGASWEPTIYQHLLVSDVVVVLIGRGTSESHWVRREIAIARALGITIVPLGFDLTRAEMDVELRQLGIDDLQGGVTENLRASTTDALLDELRRDLLSAGEQTVATQRDVLRGLRDKVDAAAPPRAQAEDPASIFLWLELDDDALNSIRALHGQSASQVGRILRAHGRVVAEGGASALLGLRIDERTTLGRVVDEWLTAGGRVAPRGHEASAPGWFESLAKQIEAVVSGRLGETIGWAPYRTQGDESVIPYVAGSRTMSGTGGLQVLVHFVPMSARSVPVTERMIPLELMFRRTATPTLRLGDLHVEMTGGGRTRVPLLGDLGRPRAVLHKATIDARLLERGSHRDHPGALGVDDVSIEDFLRELSRSGARTFVVVDQTAETSHALAVLLAMPRCRDVFVTTDGSARGSVLGWLTDTMFPDTPIGGPATPPFPGVAQLDDRGPTVLAWQRALIAHGWIADNAANRDAHYGDALRRAVEALQRSWRWSDWDGVAGKHTWTRLYGGR